MNYFSVCMNFKNEAPYLKEWLDYHLTVGVDHFYLFDNNSDDNFTEIIKPYKDKKLVTLHKSNKTPIKPISYEYTLKNYSQNNKWIGFIDCDEFICPTNINNVKILLEEYEDYPALGINWKMFGSSNHIKKPNGLVIENYLYRQDDTKEIFNCSHIKSIINPKKVYPLYINPHYFMYNPQTCYPNAPLAVDTDYNLVYNKNYAPNYHAFSHEPNYNKLCINHYWCKSREEYFNRKLNKPMDDCGKQREDEFIEYDKKSNKIYDDTIIRFVEKVKNFMV